MGKDSYQDQVFFGILPHLDFDLKNEVLLERVDLERAVFEQLERLGNGRR